MAEPTATPPRRPPTSFERHIATRPLACILIALTTFFVISGITFSGLLAGEDGSESSGGQILAVDELVVRQQFAQLALDEFGDDKDTTVLPQVDNTVSIVVYYLAKGDTLFTPQGIKEMWDVERSLTSIDGYELHCQKVYDMSTTPPKDLGCKTPSSVLRDVIFRESATLDDALVASVTQKQIDEALEKYTAPEYLEQGLTFYFPISFDPKKGLDVNITRTVIYLGGPLKTFDNRFDDEEKQEEKMLDFLEEFVDVFDAAAPKTLDIYYLGDLISDFEVSGYVSHDISLMFMSSFCIMLVLLLQTQSWTIMFVGMFHIVMSYPIAVFFYHAVLMVKVFPQINLMALFLIFGIGADDIFVFVDAWKQSVVEHEEMKKPENVAERLSWAWRRATVAMFATSMTTTVAFLMAAVSPIPMIESFGIFAALMVMVNFLMSITWFPAIVVLWTKINDKHCGGGTPTIFCCFRRKRELPTTIATEIELTEPAPLAEDADMAKEEEDAGMAKEEEDADMAKEEEESVPEKPAEEEQAAEGKSGYRAVELFFYNIYAPALFKARWVVLGLGLVLIIVMTFLTTRLESPDQEPMGLPEGSNLGEAISLSYDMPSSSGEWSGAVWLLWGLKATDPIDRSDVDKNDEVHLGELNFDPTFSFDVAAQKYVFDICKELRTENVTVRGESIPMAFQKQVGCFMEDFADFEHQQFGRDFPQDASNDAKVVAERFSAFVKDPAYSKYQDWIFGLNKHSISAIRMPVNTSVSLSVGISWIQDWSRAWLKKYDAMTADHPASLGRGFAINNYFVWDRVTDLLRSSTWLSIYVSFGIACLVLLLTTGNWIVSLCAACTLYAIVVSILGTLVILGRSLSYNESLVATTTVGLCVDYTCHLAMSYTEQSHLTGSYPRTRQAMLAMGISILGGALTSVGSTSPLLFASLPYFLIMGRFICVAIILSFLWANIFFLAVLMVFGPDRYPNGDFWVMLRLVYKRLRRVSISDSPPEVKEEEVQSSTS